MAAEDHHPGEGSTNPDLDEAAEYAAIHLANSIAAPSQTPRYSEQQIHTIIANSAALPPSQPQYTQQYIATIIMASTDLTPILNKLRTSSSLPYPQTLKLLSHAKLALLKLKALTPQKDTPSPVLAQAREVYEIGALASIRAEEADAFQRFYHQLTPFYELPKERLSGDKSEKNKITGLYLLLLLTTGNYAGFHTELEGLELRGTLGGGLVEDDKYLGYPIKLERWLMEGSYDLVWKAMEGGTSLPCEEYGVFRPILTSQIRSEIASCSEKAYPSLPISSTKNLLFLESEGAVIQFAEFRKWIVKDGRIYFPTQPVDGATGEEKVKETSQIAIENTLGYARELETIV